MKSVAAQGEEGLLSVAYSRHQQQSLVVPYILRFGKEVTCDGKLVGFQVQEYCLDKKEEEIWDSLWGC